MTISASGLSCSTDACLTSTCIAESNSKGEPISFDCSGADVTEINISNENDQYLQIGEVQVYSCFESETETDSPTTIRCNIIVNTRLNFILIYYLGGVIKKPFLYNLSSRL